MMRTVQLAIADAVYAATVRDALSRSGPWHVESVETPDPTHLGVLVLDEEAFEHLPGSLAHPERVVLISRHNPELLAQAWDAGIVSVVSVEDSVPTLLLAIMAASLRGAKCNDRTEASEISPNPNVIPARISPQNQSSRSRRCRTP